MERVHLLDDSVVSEELVNWIRQECGLAELADELDVYVRKRVSVAAFVSTILERTGMYDSSTIKQVDRILKEQSNLTIIEKYRKRAEYLYQQGRFRQALAIYRELVEYIPSRDNTGRALLYYNMASIYAMDLPIDRQRICIMRRTCCILTNRLDMPIFSRTERHLQTMHMALSNEIIQIGRRISWWWSSCVHRWIKSGLLRGKRNW